jgi:hypothetical protein
MVGMGHPDYSGADGGFGGRSERQLLITLLSSDGVSGGEFVVHHWGGCLLGKAGDEFHCGGEDDGTEEARQQISQIYLPTQRTRKP